jgi:hypothetical protein
VTAGRRPPRKLLPDTGGPAPQEPTCLRGIANTARADTPHRLRDRDRCRDAPLLRACGDARNTAAARGSAHVTAEEYAVHLQANMEALGQRLKTKRYRAQWGRRCSRPTANGQDRPRGIPAREEQWVPLAWAKLVTAI